MRRNCNTLNFINDKMLLHKVLREDDKSSHALVVSGGLIKYVLLQANDDLGHNGPIGTYQYLKQLY